MIPPLTPDQLRRLAETREVLPGWTLENWLARLEQLRRLCVEVNPDQSRFLADWIAELRAGVGKFAPAPVEPGLFGG